MTYIYQRKSGIYYYRKTFLLPCGRRQQIRTSLKTSDPILAQYLALRLHFNIASDRDVVGVISDKQTGEQLCAITQPCSPKLIVETAVAEYLAEKARARYWTDREYRRGEVMLQALATLLGTLDVGSVGRREANQFKESLLATSRSITTVNNYIKRAAMLFDWLLQRGDCSENVFRGMNVKQRRLTSALRSAYSAADKIAFLQFANRQEEWRKWILLILRYTGARPLEICQLYKSDIDVARCTINIQAGQPDQTLKTLSSARSIPIHSQLLKAGIIDFINNVQHPRLFPQLNHVKSGGYSHTFVTWCSKARTKALEAGQSLPGLYGARHTAATEMKNAGIPNQFAAAVLGHSNDSITYDRYGKGVDVKHLVEAVEAIGHESKTNQSAKGDQSL